MPWSFLAHNKLWQVTLIQIQAVNLALSNLVDSSVYLKMIGQKASAVTLLKMTFLQLVKIWRLGNFVLMDPSTVIVSFVSLYALLAKRIVQQLRRIFSLKLLNLISSLKENGFGILKLLLQMLKNGIVSFTFGLNQVSWKGKPLRLKLDIFTLKESNMDSMKKSLSMCSPQENGMIIVQHLQSMI